MANSPLRTLFCVHRGLPGWGRSILLLHDMNCEAAVLAVEIHIFDAADLEIRGSLNSDDLVVLSLPLI